MDELAFLSFPVLGRVAVRWIFFFFWGLCRISGKKKPIRLVWTVFWVDIKKNFRIGWGVTRPAQDSSVSVLFTLFYFIFLTASDWGISLSSAIFLCFIFLIVLDQFSVDGWGYFCRNLNFFSQNMISQVAIWPHKYTNK